MRLFGSVVMLAFYAATGLAFHLIAYGEVDWAGGFVYVVLAFWPLMLGWELLKFIGLVAVVVLAGLGLYWLIRSGANKLGRRI